MKVITQEKAATLIQDGMTVAIGGSGGSGSPEALLRALKDRYIKTAHPYNITVIGGISPGNLTMDEVGMNIIAQEGLIGKAICAHFGMGKAFGKMVAENKFPAFTIPLGVYNHLLRAIAGKEAGLFTHVGLHTFVDPRVEAACANAKAKALPPIVKLAKIDDKEYLFFPSFPVHACLIKATYADEDGNVSLEHEALIGEQYEIAAAVHNSHGIVIVQVEKIVPRGSLRARDVLLHHRLVDYVVVSEPDLSLGDYNVPIYRPELTGDSKIELEKLKPRVLDARKVCARRASMELKKDSLINLGVGMPDGVASIASEEGFSNQLNLSLETGPIGGVPVGGIVFGASINPDSVISTADTFDLYNGGGLDMAIVGLAQVDAKGNVNVSKFANRVIGPGGFINITQTTRNVIFMGTFTTNGLEEKIQDGILSIQKEGTIKKFVNQVEQITFSAQSAIAKKQNILYITERAVFRLAETGLELIEIAPNIDLEKDILQQMEFTPGISDHLKIMDERIFKEEKMNLILQELTSK